MHFPIIDYYRFFAAFTVCIAHYFIVVSNDPIYEFLAIVGVELFFPLSGFVLASQLSRLESNINLAKIFFIRRWMRTIPAYIVALLSAAIIYDAGSFFNLIKFTTYTQNIVTDNSIPNFFNIAWSLSIEEWFYLTLPALLWLLLKTNIKIGQKLVWICFSIIIIGLIAKILMSPPPDLWGEYIRRSVIYRIDALCYGVLAFLWGDKISTYFATLVILLFLTFISYLLLNPLILATSSLMQIIFLPACSFSFSVSLVILSKIKISNLFSIFGNYLANLSYSMYLFHLFFISFLAPSLSNLKYGVVIYFFSVVTFSTVFFYFFENPINQMRPVYRLHPRRRS